MKSGLKIVCILAILLAFSATVLSSGQALGENEHPIDVARHKIRNISKLPEDVRENLAELLDKAPRNLDKGQDIWIYERSGNTVEKASLEILGRCRTLPYRATRMS